VHDLVGFFVNTLVLWAVERLAEVLNPAQSLGQHPLFQVMFVSDDDTGTRHWQLPASACEPKPSGAAATGMGQAYVGARRLPSVRKLHKVCADDRPLACARNWTV
jgi:hypothetical protein